MKNCLTSDCYGTLMGGNGGMQRARGWTSTNEFRIDYGLRDVTISYV